MKKDEENTQKHLKILKLRQTKKEHTHTQFQISNN